MILLISFLALFIMKKEKTEETYSGVDNQVLLGQKKIPGLHLIGDFYDCKCTTEILWNIDPVRQKCLAFVETVGLHEKLCKGPLASKIINDSINEKCLL